MSMSVDEKVVSMKFDNKQFEKGVAQSIETIDKLNKSADLKGAKKGFDEFEKSVNDMNFSKLEANVSSLAHRFSAMGIAGMTAIQEVTNGAINMGRRVAGIFAAPLNQIKTGGFTRALNLEQAQFQIEGLNKDWNALVKDINYGVQDTAYSLDAAAKAAAQLSASQVQAGEDMKRALRGISGVAAMTNSSYEDISNIFTTVAGNGKLMSEQLLQLSSRGINAAATLGEQLGKSEAEIRDMVSKGKIDFATFSKAMDDAFGQHAKDANKTFEGSISNVKAALSKIGALFAAPIIQNAIAPINAFRESLNQFKAVLEEKGGIAEKFSNLAARVSEFINAIMTHENFLKSIELGTKGLVAIFNVLAQVVKRVATAFVQVFPSKTLSELKEAAEKFKNFAENIKLSEETLERIQKVARGVFSVFRIMINVMGLLKDIFIDIAKSSVGHFFLRLAAAIGEVITTFGQFVAGFHMLYKAASQTFGGIGGIFKNFGTFATALWELFKSTIGRLIPGFGELGKSAAEGAGAVSSAFSKIGAIFQAIFITIKNATIAIWNFIKTITEPFINAIKKITSGVTSTLGTMVDNFVNIFRRGDKAAENTVMFKVLSGLAVVIKIVIAALAKLGALIKHVFIVLAKEVGQAGLGNVIERMLNIGILVSIKRFLTKMNKITFNFRDIIGTFDGILNETKRSLIAFQRNMQTKRIVEIAVAIGLLAGALMLLSTLDPKQAATGIAALASTMAILVTAVIALKRLSGGNKGLGATATQMISFAIAVDILTAALRKLSQLNLKEVGTGLLALAGTMTIMVAAVKILGMGGKKMMKGALQLVFLAEAVKILAGVAKELSNMSWDEILHGLAGLGGILFEVVLFAKILGKTRIKMTTATAMVIMAQAIKQLVEPIQELGSMDWKTLGTGLAGLGALLLEIAIFSGIMSKAGKRMGIFKATAILIITQAVKQLVGVVKELGGVDIDTLKTGLGALGVVLLELAAFGAIMGRVKGGILIDSVSIVILVQALQSLVPVVQAFGGMDVASLGKGLGAIAIALIAICGALKLVGKGGLSAGLAFAAVAHGISVMAASVKMLGVLDIKELAAGVGALVVSVMALAAAVKLMKGSVAGAAAMLLVANALLVLAPAIAVLGNMPFDSMLTAIVGLAGALASIVIFGKIAGSCVAGIMALAGALAVIGVAFVAFGAGTLLFSMGINTIIDAAGKIGNGIGEILKFFGALGKGIVILIKDIVKGLIKGAGLIAKAVAVIIVKIVGAIAKHMPDIVDAAYKLILGFINGLADGAEKYLPQIMNSIGKLMSSIVKGFKAWFEQFTDLGVAGMAKMIGAVLMVLGLFKLLSKAVSGFRAANVAGALVMVAGIAAIVAGLMMLAAVPWPNLIAAAVALTATLSAFAGAMIFISKVKLDVAQVAIFLLGALSLYEIAGALMLLASQPWQNFIPAAIAILAVLVGYTAIFTFISKIHLTPDSMATLALFALGLLAIIPIVAAIKDLAREDYRSLLSAATSIVEVLAGYAVVFKVMSTIPIPMAIAAIANMAVAVLGITALIAIMGALRQIPGFDWLIGEGGQLLMKIGEILGGFVGSIIAGFGKAVSSMLPQLGADLGSFMVNASPFFMGLKMIDSKTIDSATSLAGAILALSGSAFIDAIGSFLGADIADLGPQLVNFGSSVVAFAEVTKNLDTDQVQSAAAAAALLAAMAGDMPLEGGLLGAIIGDRMPVDKLGEQLPALGEGIAAFADSVKDIKPASIEAGLNAAKVLTALAGDTPLEGGLLGAIIGDRLPLDKLGEQLPKLGEGIMDFATNVDGLDASAVEKGGNAAKMLIALSGDTPLEGGILGGIIGDRLPLDKLGEQLPKLGEGISDFAKNVADLDAGAVAKGGFATQMLINLSKEIPAKGGLLGMIMGESDDLDEFGEKLPVLGTGLKDFAANVAGLDMNAATNAATVADMLVALATKIPDSGGIKSWFEGDNTLDDFGEQLPDFGASMKEFGDKVAGIDTGSVNACTGSIRSIVYMMETFTKGNITLDNFNTLSQSLKDLGTGYRQMALDMASSSTDGPEKFKKGIDTIASAVKKLAKTDTSKVKTFFNNVSGLTDVGVKDISTAANDSVSGALKSIKGRSGEFKKAGVSLISALSSGIKSKSKSVSRAAKSAANGGIKAINNMKKSYQAAGLNVAKGFTSGVKGKTALSAAAKAGAALAKASLNGIKKEADIHSPSKKAKKHGENVGKGFKEGVNAQEENARKAGEGLSAKTLFALQSNTSKFGDAGANSANSFISSFQNTINNSGINQFMNNKNIGLDKIQEKITGKKVKKKKKPKEKKPAASTPSLAAGAPTDTKKGSGGGGGGSTKKETWTKKDAEKAAADYKAIVGSFVKDTKDFSKKFLKVGTSKTNGVAFVKVTADYIRSAIKNKSLRTAVSVFGSGLASSINKELKVALKKNKAYKNIEKKMSKAGKKLNAAKENKKEAEAAIKNKKSTAKQVAAAKKELAKANKDIKKYQKEIDKYGKKLKKVANATAKSITTKELKDVAAKFSKFKKQFNAMEKGLGKSLAKIPKVVGSYIKNTKSSTEYMKGAVNQFNKLFGKGGEKAINRYAKKMYEATDAYKQDVKTVEKLNKKHNENVKKANDLKNKIKKTSNVKLKKKYKEELAQLKKDDKALIKELNTTVTRIAKGPAKALKEYKKKLVENYKSFANISNWDISPRINLQGFDAMGDAAAKFSIFGDVMDNAAKSFDMFSVTVSDSIDDVAEAFDILNNSMDTGMNLFERFVKTGTTEKEALIENADSQLNAYEEFYEGIKKLRETSLDSDLIDELEDQGPQALSYIRGFLTMGDEEIAAYNERIEKKHKWEAQVLERNMQKQLSQYEKYNQQIEELASRGLSEGIVKKLKESGVSQAAYVKAMLHMDDAMMSSVKDIYAKSVTYGTADARQAAIDAGEEVGLSYRQALHKALDKDKEWEDKLKRLADLKVHPEIIKQFREMGADSASAMVDSILKEGEAGIADINAMYTQYSQLTTRSFLEVARENQKNAAEYNKTMDRLKREAVGLDPAIIKYIENVGGEEALAYANSILSHLEDIPSINELYWESGQSDVDTVIRNINSQADFYDAYVENWEKLEKRFEGFGAKEKEKYLKYLQDMGLEGNDLVLALVNASDEKLKEYREAIDRQEDANNEERAKATLEAFQKRKKMIDDYVKNVKKLIEIGVSQSVLDDIALIGETDPQAAAEKANDLINLYTISPEKFKQLNDEYSKYMTDGAASTVNKLIAEYAKGGDQLDKEAEKVKEKSKQLGKETVSGYTEGVNNSIEGDLGKQLTSAGTKMGKKVGKAASKEVSKQISTSSIESAISAMDEALGSKTVKKNLKKVGAQINTAVSNGLEESQETVTNAAKTVANGIYNKFNNKLSIANGKTIANNFMSAIKSTMNSYYSPLITLANSIAVGVYSEFSSRMTYSNGYSFSTNLLQGMINGLNNKALLDELRAAAARAARAANAAAAEEADENSPSKVWEQIGNYMGQGMAIGLNKTEGVVSNAAASLVASTTDSLQETIALLYDGLTGELDLNPVITPTLDLSKVTIQARQLNSLIDNQQIESATIRNAKPEAENQNAAVTQNFVQNNYSPKALSREEIYRQTKNQFALAREVVKV